MFRLPNDAADTIRETISEMITVYYNVHTIVEQTTLYLHPRAARILWDHYDYHQRGPLEKNGRIFGWIPNINTSQLRIEVLHEVPVEWHNESIVASFDKEVGWPQEIVVRWHMTRETKPFAMPEEWPTLPGSATADLEKRFRE